MLWLLLAVVCLAALTLVIAPAPAPVEPAADAVRTSAPPVVASAGPEERLVSQKVTYHAGFRVRTQAVDNTLHPAFVGAEKCLDA